jgi:hypothetical protein
MHETKQHVRILYSKTQSGFTNVHIAREDLCVAGRESDPGPRAKSSLEFSICRKCILVLCIYAFAAVWIWDNFESPILIS